MDYTVLYIVDLWLLVVNFYLSIVRIGCNEERIKWFTIRIAGWMGTWISYGKNSKENQGYLILSGLP